MTSRAAYVPGHLQPTVSRGSLIVVNLRINNVEIPNSKRIETSLQYIFGIGETTAKIILHDSVSNVHPFHLLLARKPE